MKEEVEAKKKRMNAQEKRRQQKREEEKEVVSSLAVVFHIDSLPFSQPSQTPSEQTPVALSLSRCICTCVLPHK